MESGEDVLSDVVWLNKLRMGLDVIHQLIMEFGHSEKI